MEELVLFFVTDKEGTLEFIGWDETEAIADFKVDYFGRDGVNALNRFNPESETCDTIASVVDGVFFDHRGA